MMSSPPRAASRLRLIVVIALAVMLSPVATAGGVARAQSALYPGAVGLVANTGGDSVLLRETPSFDAAVLSSFPEGTPVDILEGPVTGDDGTAWYSVAAGGVTGYLVAGYLQAAPSDPAAAEPAPVELAQPAAPVEAAPAADAIPAPAASLSDVPANPVATTELNLRSGPSYDDGVLLVIPAGAALTPTGDFSEGFVGVTYEGQYGWVDSSWLGSAGAAPQEAALDQQAAAVPDAEPVAEPAPAADPALVGDLAAPAGETAAVLDVANLRAGPSEGDAVLRVLPAGGPVTITGAPSDGWTPVWYNGTWGYIRADLLAADGAPVSLAQDAAAPADTAPATADPNGGPAATEATTLSDVNLRADPGYDAMVLTIVPAGVPLTPLAGPEQGFYQVQYGGQTGWIDGQYLQLSASEFQRGDRDKQKQDEAPGKVTGSEPASVIEPGSGGIIWPVSGGDWYIMQGYNGSSHENESSLWQYEYSLDIARQDGNTAGQEVISPVNGTVRWTDPSSGGISIDIGNGHAVAMFHVTFDGSLQAGTPVQQGQHMGQISGPGGPGWAGVAHLHFTLWTSNDQGNWDRHAVPFTGPYTISGMDFPDIGGGNEYQGTQFRP